MTPSLTPERLAEMRAWLAVMEAGDESFIAEVSRTALFHIAALESDLTALRARLAEGEEQLREQALFRSRADSWRHAAERYEVRTSRAEERVVYLEGQVSLLKGHAAMARTAATRAEAQAERLREAAEAVCWFDCSTDNDADFVEAVDRLRAALAAEPAGPAEPRGALFQRGDFTLHSGSRSAWKIECDALTDEDWRALAEMIAERCGMDVHVSTRTGRIVGQSDPGAGEKEIADIGVALKEHQQNRRDWEATRREPGAWIDWHGGKCPVPPETMVEVRLHCGERMVPKPAGKLRWSHSLTYAQIAFDIIAYRILPEARSSAEEQGTLNAEAAGSSPAAPATPSPAPEPATVSLTDLRVIIAGIRKFGLASDGSDLRDLERAIDRLQAAPEPAGEVDYEALGRVAKEACHAQPGFFIRRENWTAVARAVISAYEASRPAMREGWRPIDSAPLDGTEVDIWLAPLSDDGKPLTPSRLPNAHFHCGEWLFYGYALDPEGGWIPVKHRITHWMPLPAAPSPEGRG